MKTEKNIIQDTLDIIMMGKKTEIEIRQSLEHLAFMIKMKLVSEDTMKLFKRMEDERKKTDIVLKKIGLSLN